MMLMDLTRTVPFTTGHADSPTIISITVGALIMRLPNSASNPNLKSINFQFCVTSGSLSFYCCVMFPYIVRGKSLERRVHFLCRASFVHTMSTSEHGRHLLGKGYKSQRTKQSTQPICISSAQECAERSSR